MNREIFVLSASKCLRALIIWIFVVSWVPHARAATDGALGNTTTGTTNFTLTIPKLITIIHMADFAFGTYSETGLLEANRNVSVSMNVRAAGSRLYRVTATGSCSGNSPANGFNISNGSELLPYTVFFNNAANTSGEVQLTAGTASSSFGSANFPLTVTTDNANYHVRFSQTVLQNASVGSYTGVLTFVLAPQ